MQDTSVNGRKQGWLAPLLLVPILIAAAVVGFFVLVVILGLALLVAAGLLLRIWWLRRKLRKSGSSQTLEGEYVVIREPAMNGGSADREAVSTGTNAEADFPQRVAHDEDARR